MRRLGVWTVALVVALAGGVLAAVALGTGEAEAAIQRTLHVPASAFNGKGSAIPYNHSGLYIINDGGSGHLYIAPVYLEDPPATVQQVTLHYLDRGASGLCMNLLRPKPTLDDYKSMSAMCTKGEVNDVRAKTDTTIHPNLIPVGTTPYLQVMLPPGGAYRLYGVTIVYTSGG